MGVVGDMFHGGESLISSRHHNIIESLKIVVMDHEIQIHGGSGDAKHAECKPANGGVSNALPFKLLQKRL